MTPASTTVGGRSLGHGARCGDSCWCRSVSCRSCCALAQAAAGEGEEDVVEGGPSDLAPPTGMPSASRSRSSRGSIAGAAATRDVTASPATSTRRVRGSRGDGGRGRPASVAVVEAEGDQVAGELGLERRGGVVGDDAAVVDHHDPLGERVGLVEVVRGEHDRRAVLGAQAQDVLLQVGPALRVEAGRRLVEEEQLAAGGPGPSAMSSRRRWPPESVRDLPVGELARSRASISSSARRARLARAEPVDAALADQLVAHALAVARAVALADVADRAAHVARARSRCRARRPRPCPRSAASGW